MLVRDLERGGAARERIRSRFESDSHLELHSCDLGDLAAVSTSPAASLAEERLDVLVHNAGVFPAERQRTQDGFELTFATNVLGPVPAHRAAARAPPRWAAPPRDQRLLGRHVHRAAGPRRPAADEREFDGAASTRHQARRGGPHRGSGRAAREPAGSACHRCTRAGPTRPASRVAARFHRLMRPLLRDAHSRAPTRSCGSPPQAPRRSTRARARWHDRGPVRRTACRGRASRGGARGVLGPVRPAGRPDRGTENERSPRWPATRRP